MLIEEDDWAATVASGSLSSDGAVGPDLVSQGLATTTAGGVGIESPGTLVAGTWVVANEAGVADALLSPMPAKPQADSKRHTAGMSRRMLRNKNVVVFITCLFY
jgi:hypothetical protein